MKVFLHGLHLSYISLAVAGLGVLLSRFLEGRYINLQNE